MYSFLNFTDHLIKRIQKKGLSNSLQKLLKNYYNELQFQLFPGSFTALLSITCPNLCQSCLVIDNHLYTDLISTPSLFLSHEHWQSVCSQLSFEPLVYRIAANSNWSFHFFRYLIMNQVWKIHLHLHFPINFTGRIPLNT